MIYSNKQSPKYFAILLLCFCSGLGLSAQESWSLEKCIQQAQQSNLTLKQSQLSLKSNELNLEGHRKSRLPNLNANVNGSLNGGRSLDFTTYEFENKTIGGNSFSISSGMPLYNGNRISNSIKQSQFDIAAAAANLQQTTNDIALQIANSYLSILLAEERLENARKQKEQTQQQLSQIEKLINAGSRPANDRLDLLATIAGDEQNIVLQENNVTIAYLTLKQLLLLEPDYDMQVVRPEIALSNSLDVDFIFRNVYDKALQNQPAIVAAENQLKSAELGVDIAKAGKMPSLNLSGSLNSRYSSTAKNILSGEDLKYFKQIDQNFSQNIGLNLSIPIYNNHRNSIAMERAELGIIQTQLNNRQIKEGLKADVQRAIANAKAAAKTLVSAQKTEEARKAAYDNSDKRYQLGAINSFELTTSKNQLDQATVNLIVAKYDYLFKLKVVDYYLGNEIKLD